MNCYLASVFCAAEKAVMHYAARVATTMVTRTLRAVHVARAVRFDYPN